MTEIPKAAKGRAKRIVAAYERGEEVRNAGLRALRDEFGLSQKDIIGITGYSRETVRFALMTPEEWAEKKRLRRERRSED